MANLQRKTNTSVPFRDEVYYNERLSQPCAHLQVERRTLETIQYSMEKSKLGGALKGIRGFPLRLREKLGEGVEMNHSERNKGWSCLRKQPTEHPGVPMVTLDQSLKQRKGLPCIALQGWQNCHIIWFSSQ